jgi:H+/Cl- antiporter ClcA
MGPLNRSELKTMLDSFTHGDWGNRFENLSNVFLVTSLGAIVLGVFFGLIGSVTYRIIAKRTAASYALLRDKLHHHKHCQRPFNPDI